MSVEFGNGFSDEMNGLLVAQENPDGLARRHCATCADEPDVRSRTGRRGRAGHSIAISLWIVSPSRFAELLQSLDTTPLEEQSAAAITYREVGSRNLIRGHAAIAIALRRRLRAMREAPR